MKIFKPMLAGKVDASQLEYPLAASPKLDGVRAVCLHGTLLSRSFKPIPNEFCQRQFSQLDWLDGELIVGDPQGKNVYNHTVSGVMTHFGEPDVTFWVFDCFKNQEDPFLHRLKQAEERLSNTVRTEIVPHTIVSNETQLIAYEEWALAQGYEGVMLRHPDGPYKCGRSTTREGWLLKLKRFADSEAVILGWEEKLHNANPAKINELGHQERSSHKEGMVPTGVLGALHCRDVHSGVEFSIGSGFSDDDRANLWLARDHLMGRVVKYKYQPAGVLDKPRFPIFLGFRPEGA